MECKKIVILSLFTIQLTACNNNSNDKISTSSQNINTTQITLTGIVINDTVLKDTLVCLDNNNNLICDPLEPQTKTNNDGIYRLSVPESNAKQSAIVAQTTDLSLTAPIGKHAVISPLTSLISAIMPYYPQATAEDVAYQIANSIFFSMPSQTLLQDYIHNSLADTKNLADIVSFYLKGNLAVINSTPNSHNYSLFEKQQLAASYTTMRQLNVLPLASYHSPKDMLFIPSEHIDDSLRFIQQQKTSLNYPLDTLYQLYYFDNSSNTYSYATHYFIPNDNVYTLKSISKNNIQNNQDSLISHYQLTNKGIEEYQNQLISAYFGYHTYNLAGQNKSVLLDYEKAALNNLKFDQFPSSSTLTFLTQKNSNTLYNLENTPIYSSTNPNILDQFIDLYSKPQDKPLKSYICITIGLTIDHDSYSEVYDFSKGDTLFKEKNLLEIHTIIDYKKNYYQNANNENNESKTSIQTLQSSWQKTTLMGYPAVIINPPTQCPNQNQKFYVAINQNIYAGEIIPKNQLTYYTLLNNVAFHSLTNL